jgi:DNA-binding transcriptional regulator GbsR (MarR family)
LQAQLKKELLDFYKKKYSITISEISNELKLSVQVITRVLKKFQLKRIVALEPLPGKTYVRLLRNDFSFITKKRQKKFIKHKADDYQSNDEYDGIMYS